MSNKGIALPIEYIVVIIICVVTLLAVLILFGIGTGGCNELVTRTDLNKACGLVAPNCNPATYTSTVQGANLGCYQNTNPPIIPQDRNYATVQDICNFYGYTTIQSCYSERFHCR